MRSSKAPMALLLSPMACDLATGAKPDVDVECASTQLAESATGASQLWSPPFVAVNCQLRLAVGSESQRDEIVALLAILAQRVDLAEPFGRIHEAIREAQRIGGQASDDRSQAA
jgi:hypothetical protein